MIRSGEVFIIRFYFHPIKFHLLSTVLLILLNKKNYKSSKNFKRKRIIIFIYYLFDI